MYIQCPVLLEQIPPPPTSISFNIMTIKFTGRHFPAEIILQSVRYYVSYKLGYREIEEVLVERGINVDHSILNCWVSGNITTERLISTAISLIF